MAATLEQLLAAGVHFGHLTRRWNPKMRQYIFMERNGIHILDLNKTRELLTDACNAATRIASEGRKFLFVGTKKQAREVITAEAQRCGMHFVTERWLGGMLTNFTTVRKSLKRLATIDKMETDGTLDKITKKEVLMISREKTKLMSVLGGISDMTRLPGALFIVDIKKEHIAVKEARVLGIPVFALVDTNVDPELAEYPIPANDDAVKSIAIITKEIADAIEEGFEASRARRAEESAHEEQVQKTREPKEQREPREPRRPREVRA